MEGRRRRSLPSHHWMQLLLCGKEFMAISATQQTQPTSSQAMLRDLRTSAQVLVRRTKTPPRLPYPQGLRKNAKASKKKQQGFKKKVTHLLWPRKIDLLRVPAQF